MLNRAAVLIAIACGIASALFSWKVLGLIPHVPDELSYLYQGRILASGHLSVPEPAVPEAFTVAWDHILRESGRWRAIYPPGWPLLLMIGWWIRAPWLINPILLSLSGFGLFRLARELFDDRTAIFALIAFASSPFVLLMGSGFMAHPSTLCFAIWGTFFLVRGKGRDFVYGAMCGAFAFVIRPYTAVPLLLPIVVWTFARASQRKQTVLQLVVGAAPFVILFLLYNALQFGFLFRTGYSYDPDASFRGSLFENFWTNFRWYFASLNRSLWNFPWTDLLLFLPLLVPHKKWKLDLLLAVSFASLTLAYSVFYYKDIVYGGPRYVYEALGFLAILAGRAIRIFETGMERFIYRRIGTVVLFIFLYPLAVTLPVQLSYHKQAYHGQTHELIDLVESSRVGNNALVLISGDPHVFRTFYLENGLMPGESSRVYARDLPGLREELLQAYGRDEVWTLRMELTMLKGVNRYEDRARIRSVELKRVR